MKRALQREEPPSTPATRPPPSAPRVPVYRASEPQRVELHPETAAPEEAPVEQPAPRKEGVFLVRLTNEAEGLDVTIEVLPGEPVLDAADRAGLDLPYSCRNGGCTVCAGRLVEGASVMSDEQYTLEEEHLAQGFRLLCCAVVEGDATFLTHQNDAVS
ncbi:MAG: 2Fe-2S iron-sulfur cluster binding domain-containing protein [Alphaproteobacteria bacterium]|nr:2Fe-2S iron-sulfur cluster binding domain-containing protein [Alphaproteobacteria bacterium]